MSTSVYTLLIVESPVMARIIQNLSPRSVYVVATEGFCWRPKYNAAAHQLKAIADPDKVDIRKEIKEQAAWANSVIIATDSDPSGDFIAWSVSRFLKSNGVKRGYIQNLSKNGIHSMLSEVQQLDEPRLETRLKNRFLINDLWQKNRHLPDMQLAGLTAIFGANNSYNHFLNDGAELFISSEPISCSPGELFTVVPQQKEQHYAIHKPLSTYDVVASVKELGIAKTYQDAQLLLQQLFQTSLHSSGESLISYPRTDANALYSETWESMRRQYMKLGSVNQLKPRFLQEIAGDETPHESICPLNLSVKPKDAAGELSSGLGSLYRFIYNHTLRSITMPAVLEHSFVNELNPGIYFYPAQSQSVAEKSISVNPCVTVSDLGMKLNRMGVVKPSAFGKALDAWAAKGWIQISNNVAIPGKPVLQRADYAAALREKLLSLNRMAENNTLSGETVQTLLTS